MKKAFKLRNTSSSILEELGENIKLARLRRRLSTTIVAERAGITRMTLWSIEKGSPGVSVGFLLKVLKVLGLERDILNVAKDDILGRKLQDANLVVKSKSPRKVWK
ncbi:MAG: XRE family transcriptional regulator [Ignavibacteriae bacterium]|nr:MAG: XRE family transcriptional regulator [Ignavibacteriota bacterium]